MVEPLRDDEESPDYSGSILFQGRGRDTVEDLRREVDRLRRGQQGMHGSMAYGYTHVSMAMAAPRSFGEWANRPRQYQYTEKFPPEVRKKAWKLLEQFMNPSQHFAFMEGADIELENPAKDFRLIINRSGKFIILEGSRGSGIVAQSGNVRGYKYPLGDEIAAFIDWFNHRTKELIAQWGCGTYGIVKEGERR